MTMLVVFSLGVCALIAFIFTRSWLWQILAGLAVISLLLASTPFFPQTLMSSLRAWQKELSSPQWKENNAIIVLGFGLSRVNGEVTPGLIGMSRLGQAVRQYTDCIAASKVCTLITTGGDPQKQGISEADMFAKVMMGMGVPKSDILTETASNTTIENANLTTLILKENRYDGVFLVTSSFHMKRAIKLFQRQGIEVYPLPAADLAVGQSWVPSGMNIVATDAAIHELLALARLG